MDDITNKIELPWYHLIEPAIFDASCMNIGGSPLNMRALDGLSILKRDQYGWMDLG